MHYHRQALARSFLKYFARVLICLDESCSQCFCNCTKCIRYFSKFRVFLKKCRKKPTVDSEPSFSRRFRKRQKWSYPKGRDKVNLEKKCFILYFYSDKLGHYKTYDSRKYLIRDAFKHVWLQNTFDRCKVHQNIMSIQIIYFLQDLARFLQKMEFLQDSRNTILQNFCKKWESVAGLLQELCKIHFQIHQSSKICIFTRFCKNCFSCELGHGWHDNQTFAAHSCVRSCWQTIWRMCSEDPSQTWTRRRSSSLRQTLRPPGYWINLYDLISVRLHSRCFPGIHWSLQYSFH